MKQLITLANTQKSALVLVMRVKMKKRMNLLPLLWPVSLNDQQLIGNQSV